MSAGSSAQAVMMGRPLVVARWQGVNRDDPQPRCSADYHCPSLCPNHGCKTHCPPEANHNCQSVCGCSWLNHTV